MTYETAPLSQTLLVMQENAVSYPGKLLLFGEHVVVQGAQALAVPLPVFNGSWDFSAPSASERASILTGWVDYLEEKQISAMLGCRLDLERFRKDLAGGLFFNSNIPQGYGAGSSGALCAALYARYALSPIPRGEESAYPELKAILGNIESFFHGKSSGADPLVSYVNEPLLFDHGGTIRKVSLEGAKGHLFLLDTGKARQTAALVQEFQRLCANDSYVSNVLAELVPATEDAIQCLISGDLGELYEAFRGISYFQYRFMEEFILPSWREIWLEALSEEAHLLKLCGAGGGGFVLGLSRNVEMTKQQYSGLKPIFLPF